MRVLPWLSVLPKIGAMPLLDLRLQFYLQNRNYTDTENSNSILNRLEKNVKWKCGITLQAVANRLPSGDDAIQNISNPWPYLKDISYNS